MTQFDITHTIEPDHGSAAPWEECDGHGPVSDWTSRAKLPGELVLSVDRNMRRYYDFATACKMARQDGWGYAPGKLTVEKFPNGQWQARFAPWPYAPSEHCYVATAGSQGDAIALLYANHRATMNERDYAAKAAMSDYEYLRKWCNDEWHYIGVIVTASRNGIELGNASLWCIESHSDDYIESVIADLTEEAIDKANATIATLFGSK